MKCAYASSGGTVSFAIFNWKHRKASAMNRGRWSFKSAHELDIYIISCNWLLSVLIRYEFIISFRKWPYVKEQFFLLKFFNCIQCGVSHLSRDIKSHWHWKRTISTLHLHLFAVGSYMLSIKWQQRMCFEMEQRTWMNFNVCT